MGRGLQLFRRTFAACIFVLLLFYAGGAISGIFGFDLATLSRLQFIPAFLENGITGFMQPILEYSVHRFCDYECRKCIGICPTSALGDLTLAEKKLTRIGVVKLILDECIVIKENKACGACAEHCPTGALRMVSHKSGIPKPDIVNKEVCIGCGGCELICPVRKLAVYIERLDIHEKAEKPKIVKQEIIEINVF